MGVFVSKMVFSTEQVFEIWGVPKISKPMSASILWMGLLCKMCAADPRNLATKFPKNSGTWGSWLGLRLAGTLWAAIGLNLKKVEGPEFPPWGAGPAPVTVIPLEGEYPTSRATLLVSRGFGGVTLGSTSRGVKCCCRNGILAATADAARARKPGAVAAGS